MYSSGPNSNADTGGHSLGGSGPPASSPQEMRRRRLAALGGGANSEAVATSTLNDDDVDDSAELQAALAMSLEKNDNDVSMEEKDTVKNNEPMEKQAPGSECHVKDSNEFNVSAFHAIMWDTAMTTDNDKSRWVNQGIETREALSTTTTSRPENMLALIGSDHGPWGLTQAHGGPCGVLAAVQAELLRLLLFGQRNDTLDYPTEIKHNEKEPPVTSITQDMVKRGLAMSIAIILARAAITPPADEGKTPTMDYGETRVCVVLPATPTQEGLSWNDLEPWSSPSALPPSPPNLRVYTVSSPPQNVNHGKRQKTGASASNGDVLEERIVRLGHAVANFLLQPLDDTQSPPLDSFTCPGGVLLLVMSLVSCRGQEVIRSDMDDPTGTTLTSQFGHCSQELINLLLTGQAVSNVFDNTLTPSGALTCRGVQSRPAVGYLSQLESLRYCEVGGYYKSPRFPIWVVGSTSHFTVLFGSASCLQESESDLLLEKCRRAFKAVEGGEENGFISTSSLGPVLQSLEINVEANAVQTLAATLEVSGANIILWDDFWKASSRLLTGASIESVLQGDGGGGAALKTDTPPPLLITQHGEADAATQPASHKSLVDSDEELARKLAAEWSSPGVADGTVSSSDAVAARPASPMDMDAPPPSSAGMSDEEYARMLQAEFDGTSGQSNPTPSEVVIVGEIPAAAPPGTPPSSESKLQFEQLGNSFKLYHYNGLRGGTLTPFCVTRLSADEAVGHSIALTQHSGASGGSAPQGAGGGDLGDVVRTKWPSCSIDWLGHSPPYID